MELGQGIRVLEAVEPGELIDVARGNIVRTSDAKERDTDIQMTCEFVMEQHGATTLLPLKINHACDAKDVNCEIAVHCGRNIG